MKEKEGERTRALRVTQYNVSRGVLWCIYTSRRVYLTHSFVRKPVKMESAARRLISFSILYNAADLLAAGA